MNSRIQSYSHISTALACLSNQRISDLLNKTTPLHAGIGGESVLLTLDDSIVFVKKIPLTDLERQPGNMMSTANLFNLPLYYQYGVGSAGFGGWRELAAHSMTTNWVLSGECPNFPVMYHWRIIPDAKPEPLNAVQAEALERQVAYWGGSPQIRNRLEAIHASSAKLVIFIEYIPHVLYQWLGREFAKNNDAIEQATHMVESNLNTIHDFLTSKGFIHFDAHFANILTNGNCLYLTDFGLAVSSEFTLSHAEKIFFEAHKHYDRCQTYTNLVNWIVIELSDSENHQKVIKEMPILLPKLLQEYDKGKALKGLTPSVVNILMRYADITFRWNDFFDQMRCNDKKAVYPADDFTKFLNRNLSLRFLPILNDDGKL